MKVLHVTAGLGAALGGPTTAAIQMCDALAKRGVDVTLVGTDLAERGSFAPGYRPLRISEHEKDNLARHNVDIRIFETEWPTRYAYSPGLRRFLKRELATFDLLHAHSVYVDTSLVATRLARASRVPYVLRPHGSFMPHLRGRSRLAKSIFHRTLGRTMWNSAAAIHYTSERERDQAQDLRIAAPSAVVPLGIDLSEFGALPPRGTFRQTRPEVGDKQLVVFLGRLAPRKGLGALIQAFAMLSRSVSAAHLVLAGPDEFGYAGKLRSQILNLGLETRVTMTGLLTGKDKLALLADTDVWVLPSSGENFGIAVVEAMAAGCAVVLSDKVDIQQELADQGAVEVSSIDSHDLCTVIGHLLAHRAERERLSHRARLVAGTFSWETRVQPLIDLYLKVLKRAG